MASQLIYPITSYFLLFDSDLCDPESMVFDGRSPASMWNRRKKTHQGACYTNLGLGMVQSNVTIRSITIRINYIFKKFDRIQPHEIWWDCDSDCLIGEFCANQPSSQTLRWTVSKLVLRTVDIEYLLPRLGWCGKSTMFPWDSWQDFRRMIWFWCFFALLLEVMGPVAVKKMHKTPEPMNAISRCQQFILEIVHRQKSWQCQACRRGQWEMKR